MPPTTAVIIDDQDDIRFLIKQILELSGDGLRVIAEAPDGQSALDVLREMSDDVPTVVVTDWMMPGMNGIETSIAIKAQRPDIRIILCSAFGDAALREEAAAAGIDLVMSKDQIVDMPRQIHEMLQA